MIEDVIGDVQPLKKKAGAEIQDGRNIGKLGSRDRRWKRTQGAINRSLQDKGETLPSMRKEEWQRAARSHKANAGVGSDNFYPTALLDFSGELCVEVTFLSKLELCGH